MVKEILESSEFINGISTAVEKKLDEILTKVNLNEQLMENIQSSVKVTKKLYADMQSQINNINGGLTSRCDKLESALFDLQNEKDMKDNKILALESTLERKCNTITALDNSVNQLEQYSRRNCIRIFGIEEKQGENTDQLICEVAKTMKIDLQANDIDRSHRVGKKPEKNEVKKPNEKEKYRGIIVKLCSYRVRQRLILNRRKLNGSGISIHEDLTVKTLQLLNVAQKHDKVKSAWTLDGRIFVQPTEAESKKCLITCNEDLKSL